MSALVGIGLGAEGWIIGLAFIISGGYIFWSEIKREKKEEASRLSRLLSLSNLESQSIAISLDEVKSSPLQRLREEISAKTLTESGSSVPERVVEQLMNYLVENGQQDCADYFRLRLMDLPTTEIEEILGITPRERDYLQQRFKYHLLKFSFAHHWELVHEWLGEELGKNLGLTPQQLEYLQDKITPTQAKLLTMKQRGMSNTETSNALNLTEVQLRKQWSLLLEAARDIRNL